MSANRTPAAAEMVDGLRDKLFREPVASVRASLGLPDEVASPTLAEFAKQKSARADEPVEVLLRAWFVQAGAIKPANVKRDGAMLPALQKRGPTSPRPSGYSCSRSGPVTPDATAQVLAENQFNDPPPPGSQFFIAAVQATYTGTGSDTFGGSFQLSALGPSSVSYTTFGNSCGVISNEIDSYTEVFTGGTISGNVCWSVPRSDATALVMFTDAFLADDSGRVWFSLTG